MSTRLYRLDAECPTCDHRPNLWISEALYVAVRNTSPRDVLLSVDCGRAACKTRFPIHARAAHEAHFAGTLPDAGRLLSLGDVEALDPALEALSPRQMEACTLVVEGKSDVGIGLAMGLSVWTVRIHLGHAADRLRSLSPGLPSTAPRRTIQAYFAQRNVGPVRRLVA